MRRSLKKAPLLVICAGGPVLLLLISAAILGLFGALSVAPRSDSRPLQPKYDLSEATALDRDIYYWRGALLGPAAASRDNPLGMIVGRVSPHSAAAKAELKPGDIVVALDGMPVSTPRLLALAVADHPRGPVIKLQIWRNQSDRQLSLLVPSPHSAGGGPAPRSIG